MRWVPQPFFIILTVGFQVSAGAWLGFGTGQVNLTLVGVVCWTMAAGFRVGLLWAILGGLLLDYLSVGPFGAYTAMFVLVAFGTSLFAERFEVHTPLPPLAAGFVATIVTDLGLLLMYQITGRPVDLGTWLVPVILPEAIFNALLAAILVWPAIAIERRLQATLR